MHNLLPQDGECLLEPNFLSQQAALDLFEQLKSEIDWQTETLQLYGQSHQVPRLICWMGDASYTYSNQHHEPNAWHPAVLTLKHQLEQHWHTPFNGVLLNYYRHGHDHMGWHRDNEPALGAQPTIASISLGQTRRFHLRHLQRKLNQLDPVRLDLHNGSCLLMRGDTQTHWQHRLSPTKQTVSGRINLTFRRIIL